MRPNACITCKWRELQPPLMKYSICTRPVEAGPLNSLCQDERKAGGQCGRDGQFWEQKA